MQTETSHLAMETLKQFVVLLYDRTCDIRNIMLTQKTRSLENLPLTQEVLKQHIEQARY